MVVGMDFNIAQWRAIYTSYKLESSGLWVCLTAHYEAIIDGENIKQYFAAKVFGNVKINKDLLNYIVFKKYDNFHYVFDVDIR